MATQTPSEACCTVPPVIAKGYKEKGKYIDANGLKTYNTGPSDATTAVLLIYDIFGIKPQTLQAADILAHSDQEHQYHVFMPDFFEGKPFALEDHPPDTPEKQEKFQKFFSGPADIATTIPKVNETVKELSKANPSIKKWGVVGYCWGGKLVSLLSQEGTLFSAAAECHPAFVDAKDAAGVQIPIIVLGSSGEKEDDLKAFEGALKVPNHVEHYSDMDHGWMAARADFEDPRKKGEFERGYKSILEFFHKHL